MKLIMTTIRVREDDWNALDKLAKNEGKSRSAILREMTAERLAKAAALQWLCLTYPSWTSSARPRCRPAIPTRCGRSGVRWMTPTARSSRSSSQPSTAWCWRITGSTTRAGSPAVGVNCYRARYRSRSVTSAKDGRSGQSARAMAVTVLPEWLNCSPL
jgi:hypothetical protein